MTNDVEIYGDDIDLAMSEYVETREIEDERKMTSSMWAACMQYICHHALKDGDLLRDKNTINNEPYDLDKVLALVRKYTFLCNDHNQRICIEHFSMLSGIHKSTISLWANGLRRSDDKRAKQIYITLMENGMTAADDLALSKSGVNSIAYANTYRERYNQYIEKKEKESVLDMKLLAETLGISEQKALPDHERSVDEVEKQPWMDVELLEMDW